MSGYLVRSAHPRARMAPSSVRGEGEGAAGAGAARRWEAELFESYRDHRVPLEVVCFDDIVLYGYLRAWERYSFLLDTPDGETLVMKHGVIRMGPRATRPEGAVRSRAALSGRRVAPAGTPAPREEG